MLSHFHFPELTSTQDKAFELSDQGVELPFFVTSDLQTKGRGRNQHEWVSESGRSLTMSLLISLKVSRLIGLTLVSGLAAQKSLGLDNILIKWPNDLMIDNQKVAGLLVESRSQGSDAKVAIGLGLNLFDLQSQSYKGIQKKILPEVLAQKILDFTSSFEVSGFGPFRKAYENSMWKRGEVVRFKVHGTERNLKILGVSDEGFLRTESDGIFSLTEQGEIVNV